MKHLKLVFCLQIPFVLSLLFVLTATAKQPDGYSYETWRGKLHLQGDGLHGSPNLR